MKWNDIISRSTRTLLIENSERRTRSTCKRFWQQGFIFDRAWDESSMDYYLSNTNNDCQWIDHYNTIWLDYDLTRIWKLKNRETSLHVIKRYKKQLYNSTVKLIVIHSWNKKGCTLLYNELKDLGIEIIIKRHWRVF